MSSSYLPHSFSHHSLKMFAEKTIAELGGDPHSPESCSAYGRVLEHGEACGVESQANFEYALSEIRKAAGDDANDHVGYDNRPSPEHGRLRSIAVKVYVSDGIPCEGYVCESEAHVTMRIQGKGERHFCYACSVDFEEDYRSRVKDDLIRPIHETWLHREFTPAFIRAFEISEAIGRGEVLDEDGVAELEYALFSGAFDRAIAEAQRSYPHDSRAESGFIAQVIVDSDRYCELDEFYAMFSDIPFERVARIYESHRNDYFNLRALAILNTMA